MPRRQKTAVDNSKVEGGMDRGTTLETQATSPGAAATTAACGLPGVSDGGASEWSATCREASHGQVCRYRWLASDGCPGEATLEVEPSGPELEVDISTSSVHLVMNERRLLLPVGFEVDVDSCVVKRRRRENVLVLTLRAAQGAPVPAPPNVEVAAASVSGADGFAVLDAFLAGSEADALRQRLLGFWQAGTFGRGEVEGKSESAARARSDTYRYIEPREDALVANFARRLDRFVLQLQRQVPSLRGIKLIRGSPMATVYSGADSQYTPHYDCRGGHNGRVLTCILYLNPFWREGDGASLRLWPHSKSLTGDGPSHDVAPLHGRLVAFLCDSRNLHAVLPVSAGDQVEPRLAISCWYYDTESAFSEETDDARRAK